MKKFSFIILHYKNLKDTIECIESIKKIKTDDEVSIVVVDNNSLSNDEEKQLKKYTNDIIKLKENMGFAKGNNAGCSYATKKYNPDFLCVINNDTVINQKDFLKVIVNCYEKTKINIMCHKIIKNKGK